MAKQPRKGETYIQRQRPRAIHVLVPVHAHQTLAVLKQPRLETNDDKLHAGTGMLADILLDLLHIRIIQRGIDLVQHEKRTRLVAVDGKQQC